MDFQGDERVLKPDIGEKEGRECLAHVIDGDGESEVLGVPLEGADTDSQEVEEGSNGPDSTDTDQVGVKLADELFLHVFGAFQLRNLPLEVEDAHGSQQDEEEEQQRTQHRQVADGIHRTGPEQTLP